MIVTIIWWGLIAVAVALEVIARARPEALSSLARSGAWLARSIPGRAVLWAAWIFVGVHLFARYGVRGH
jgi:hypothetical protein